MRKLLILILGLLASVVVEAKGDGKNLLYNKGYSGNVSLGGTVGMDYNFGTRGTLFTSHGYSFGNGAFVGLGTGIITDVDGYYTIPLYADFKYSFINNTVSPFIDYKMGMSAYKLAYYGVYVSPSIGVDVGRFSFSIGYIYQNYLDAIHITINDTGKPEYNPGPGDDGTGVTFEAFACNWLTFTVAVNF